MRLGHLHNQAITNLIKSNVIRSCNKIMGVCVSLVTFVKLILLLHPIRNTIYTTPLEFVYAEL